MKKTFPEVVKYCLEEKETIYNLNEGNVSFDHGRDGKNDDVEDSPKRKREMTQRREMNVKILWCCNGLERTARRKDRY